MQPNIHDDYLAGPDGFTRDEAVTLNRLLDRLRTASGSIS